MNDDNRTVHDEVGITDAVEKYFADKFNGAYVYQATNGPEYCRLYITLPNGAKPDCEKAENDLSAIFDNRTVIVTPIEIYEADLQVDVDRANPVPYAFAEMLAALADEKEQWQIPVAVGRDYKGAPIWQNIDRVIHMLVGGIQSRSNMYIQSLLASVVALNTPDEVRIVIADTTDGLYDLFDGAPHMLFGKATNDESQAQAQLDWLRREIDRRRQLFAQAKCSNIASYNDTVDDADKLYRIIVVADDAVYMSQAVQNSLIAIYANGRAAGVHIVIKTTGNDMHRTRSALTDLPTRLVVQTRDRMVSQRMLQRSGAEKLRNFGDAFYKSIRYDYGIRVQFAIASPKELEQVCLSAKNKYVSNFCKPVTPSDD